MENITDKLFYDFGSKKKYPILEHRIKTRRGNFKKSLTKNQYRQLQRLFTDTETIEGERIYENFICGMKFVFTLMAEVYSKDIGYNS